MIRKKRCGVTQRVAYERIRQTGFSDGASGWTRIGVAVLTDPE